MDNIPPDELPILANDPESGPEEPPPAMPPKTFFDSYESRLQGLAVKHDLELAVLKALIEDAFGKCDTPPAELEAKLALMKLAKLKIGPCQINWLFQYHILGRSEHE